MTPSRLAALRGLATARGVDAVLVTQEADVRYLSGFLGDDTCLLVSGGAALICSDSRFWTQIAQEAPEFELVKTVDLLRDAAQTAAERFGAGASLGFQGRHLSYADHRLVRRAFLGGMRDLGSRVAALRLVKDEVEIAAIRRAAAITDETIAAVVAGGLAGHTERDVAWAIESGLRDRGAEGPSFDAIVAAGERGALPHAIPGDRVIAAGDLVVIDTGARVDGYCSDITRTFAVGRVSERQREVYEVVLAAQQAGLAAACGGTGGAAADAAARRVIADAGYGDFFGHGLGHGVGLEIHEGPRLGPRSRDRLAAGMVCTVEPGVYLEGEFGVRIEDTIVVGDGPPEVLTPFPKGLAVVD